MLIKFTLEDLDKRRAEEEAEGVEGGWDTEEGKRASDSLGCVAFAEDVESCCCRCSSESGTDKHIWRPRANFAFLHLLPISCQSEMRSWIFQILKLERERGAIEQRGKVAVVNARSDISTCISYE